MSSTIFRGGRRLVAVVTLSMMSPVFAGAQTTGSIVGRVADEQRGEIKGGVEYEQQDATVTKRMSGGQQADLFENAANPSRPIYRHFFWTTPDATLANAPVSRLVASPSHKNTTLFPQDKWALRPNLTLSYGVRWDRRQIIDASGVNSTASTLPLRTSVPTPTSPPPTTTSTSLPTAATSPA